MPAFAGQVARYLAVPGGREYLVRVPGSSQSPLSDAELAAVLNWILQRFGPAELAAGFPPYSAAEVARIRRPPLLSPGRERARLLAELARAAPRDSQADDARADSASKPEKNTGRSARRSGGR